MIIPENYALVQHFLEGSSVPSGAAVTYGVGNEAFFTPAALAENLHADFALHIMPNLTTSLALRTTRVKEGPNDTGPYAEFTDVVAGGNGGTSVPPNVALLVEKRTQLGGRQGQGRFFLPGMAESAVDASGLIASATVDALNADLAAFLAALDAQGSPMVLLHSTLLAPTAVTSLTADPRAATQRRRLRR